MRLKVNLNFNSLSLSEHQVLSLHERVEDTSSQVPNEHFKVGDFSSINFKTSQSNDKKVPHRRRAFT